MTGSGILHKGQILVVTVTPLDETATELARAGEEPLAHRLVSTAFGMPKSSQIR